MVAKNVGLSSAVFYLQRKVHRDESDLIALGNLDSDAFGLRFGIQVFAF